MKKYIRLIRLTPTQLVAAVLLLSALTTQAQNYWTGAGGSPGWSLPGNWLTGAKPGAPDGVIFDSFYGAPVSVQGVVNNVVDAPFTISTLGYDTVTTNGYFTSQINPGVTLSIIPQTPAANSLAVGEWIPGITPAVGGVNDQVYGTIVGTNATLSINGRDSTIRVEQSASSGTHKATLDLSRLTTFTATVSNVLIGADLPLARPIGTLLLAQTNTITTGAWAANVPGLLLGCGGATSTDGGLGNLVLGQANIFNVDWLAISGHRANQGTSTLSFAPGTTQGAFQLRGSAGGRAALFSIGDNQASDTGSLYLWGTSRGTAGLAEFRGATIDILVDSLIVGRNIVTNETTAFNTGANGVGTGTLNMDAGIIDANNVYLGYKVATNYGGATGTLSLSGGTLNVNNNVVLSARTYVNGGWNGGNGTATLNISSNAVVNVAGNIFKGTTGQGSATLNINYGGLLNLQPGSDPDPGNISLDTLSVTAGTILNASNISVGGTFTLNASTITNLNNVSASTLNVTGGGLLNLNTVAVSGTANLNNGIISNLASFTTATLAGTGAIKSVGSVTNGTSLLPGGTAAAGTLELGGDLTLKTNASLSFALGTDTTIGSGLNSYVNVSGNLSLLASNVLTVAPLGPLAAGPYRLIDYGGVLGGLPLVFTNTTRYALGLDSSAAGQINLTNGGGSGAALVWKGSTALGGTNWNLIAATNWNNNTEPFFQFDTVTFDNNAVTTNINTSGLLYPQTVLVTDSRNFLVTGSGKLSGNAGITKNGSGQLWVANTGGNDFNGALTVNAGILKIGRADSFGSTNGATTIASGAMLDLAGTAASSPGETVIISGTGITNGGAIINTGSDQNNGLRYVSLAADASIGNYPGRWDIRGPGGNSSFSAGLFLNGFTLTKTGWGKNELADTVCDGPGSLVNAAGTLAFTRSVIDGPGTISVLGTNTLQIENSSTGMVAKPIIFSGNGVLQVVGNAFVLSSPITNLAPGAAGLTIDAAVDLTLTNILSGSGALTKISSGSLVLRAPDLCTGPTTVSAGTLVLTNAGSLSATPSINLAAGTVLNVSGVNGLVLGSAQTLSGGGSILGSVTAGPGATMDPGGHPGPMTITGDLTLNGATALFELGSDPTIIGDSGNDLISVGGNLNLSGTTTIRISALAGLSTTTPYTILVYTNQLSGGLANLSVVSANPRYSFSLVDPTTTPGKIQVTVTGLPVSLSWHGGQASNPNLWDSGVTSNWLNSGVSDVFYAGDSVTFDDTATTGLVNLGSVLQPGTMAVNNNTLNYTVKGTGGLSVGSLTKAGAGSLALVNAGTNTFALGIVLNGGTLALSNSTDQVLGAVLSDSGTGGGTFQKLDTNLMVVAGNNASYNGAIVVSAGTLRPGNANALGTVVAGTTVASGATLDVNGLNLGAEAITVSGAGVGGLGAIYNSGAGQNNALLNVTLAGDTTFGGPNRWDIRTQGTTFATLSTGGQPVKLTKVGANQVSLVGVGLDDAMGDVDVQQGTLSVESTTMAPGTGFGDASKTLTIRSNAVLQLWSMNNALNKVVLMQDGSSIINGSGANIISGPVNLNGSNVFNIGTGSLVLNNSVRGSGAIYKIGGGSGSGGNGNANPLELLSDNSPLNGGMFISGGTLMLLHSFAAGVNNQITVTTTTGGGGQSGTRVNLGGGVVIPPGVSLSLPSAGSGDLRSTLESDNGVNEWQGRVALSGDGSVNFAANQSTAGLTISGPISGTVTNLILRGNNGGVGKITGSINITNLNGITGAPRLEKTEVCTWTLYTNNNTWGDTIIHNGTLQLGTNNPCPVGTLLTLGEGQSTCILDLNGFNQQIAGLVVVGVNTNTIITSTSTTTDSTLMIAGTNTTEFGGIISDVLVLTNTFIAGDRRVGLTLDAANTGSLLLSGANAYTGPTLLNGGTLLVNGSLGNTVVTVKNGATLGGVGVMLGPVTVQSGGVLALGPALGTLAISNSVLLSAGSTNLIKADPATSASDHIVGMTGITYAGTLVVSNAGAASWTAGTALKLYDASSYGGAFASIVPAAPGQGLAWDTTSLTANGTLKVVATVNPNPTNITAVIQGSKLTLSWPESHTGWALQTNAVNVGNPSFWFTYPGSTATNRVSLTIDQSKTNVFYRMALP